MAYSEIRKCWKCKDQHLASITCDEWKDIRQRTRLSAEAAAKRFGSEIADLKRKLEEKEREIERQAESSIYWQDEHTKEHAHAEALAGALEEAENGLLWWEREYPERQSPADDEHHAKAQAALTAYRKDKEPGE